ncbi:MAG: DUF5050 domain-containing protein [Lachnospiraceae bacterium]|nr:DUF5050 domain-containing protein [Lachnospiraceae bacterium]
MNKTVKTIIGIGVIVFIVGGLTLLRILGGREKKVPLNETGTVGNTAGNLYNGGLFCEKNGRVYFSNPYDSGRLYCLDKSSGEVVKLANGNAAFINAAGNYVYFYSDAASDQAGLGYVRRGRGIYRLDVNSKKKDNIMIAESTSDGMVLADNNIIYTSFGATDKNDGNALVTLNTVSIAGGEPSVLFEGHPNVGCVKGSCLYFSEMQKEGTLKMIDPISGDGADVSSERMFLPIAEGNKIYYLDSNDDYHIKVYDTSDDSIREISSRRCDTYNVYDDWIYFQTVDTSDAEGYALMRIRTDGSDEEVVRFGVHRNISITDDYVYFREFNNDVPIFRTPTSGNINITTFEDAENAVMTTK